MKSLDGQLCRFDWKEHKISLQGLTFITLSKEYILNDSL